MITPEQVEVVLRWYIFGVVCLGVLMGTWRQ